MTQPTKDRCYKCGMIRSTKDLVLLEDGKYMCFLCWNNYTQQKLKKS
ncbi:MAG: hypothetical protein ACFFDF_10825 [Candidatus Odinarchaeota archaeon]